MPASPRLKHSGWGPPQHGWIQYWLAAHVSDPHANGPPPLEPALDPPAFDPLLPALDPPLLLPAFPALPPLEPALPALPPFPALPPAAGLWGPVSPEPAHAAAIQRLAAQAKRSRFMAPTIASCVPANPCANPSRKPRVVCQVVPRASRFRGSEGRVFDLHSETHWASSKLRGRRRIVPQRLTSARALRKSSACARVRSRRTGEHACLS
jgi:hypothetical protein